MSNAKIIMEKRVIEPLLAKSLFLCVWGGILVSDILLLFICFQTNTKYSSLEPNIKSLIKMLDFEQQIWFCCQKYLQKYVHLVLGCF